MPFLVYRGPRYAPMTPPPEDPRLRSAWERGRAPFNPGQPFPPELASWGPDERRALREGAMSRRSQRDLRAPVGWSTQIALLVLRAAALFGAETCRERYGRLAEGAVGLVLYWPVMFVEQRLEARQADILRLTAETAPRPVFDPSSAVVPLVFSIVARLRGLKVADATPPVALAQQIVGEINRRRSWRAALPADGRSG